MPDTPRTPVIAMLGWPGAGLTSLARGLVCAAEGTPGPGPVYAVPDGPVLLDAPASLLGADALLLVISAVDGIDAGSVATWRAAEDAELPRLIAVAKSDLPAADADELLALCRRLFGAGPSAEDGDEVVALAVPLHGGSPEAPAGADGLLDLVTSRVHDHTAGGDGGPVWTPQVMESPGEFLVAAEGLREELLEAVLTMSEDPALLDNWLLGLAPSPSVLAVELAAAVAAGLVHPLQPVSGVTGLGCWGLLALLRTLPLEPAAAPPVVHPDGSPAHPEDDTLLAVALGGGAVRVLSGTLQPGTLLRGGAVVGVLSSLAGAPLTEAGAGVVLVLPGLTAEPGTLLSAASAPLQPAE